MKIHIEQYYRHFCSKLWYTYPFLSNSDPNSIFMALAAAQSIKFQFWPLFDQPGIYLMIDILIPKFKMLCMRKNVLYFYSTYFSYSTPASSSFSLLSNLGTKILNNKFQSLNQLDDIVFLYVALPHH